MTEVRDRRKSRRSLYLGKRFNRIFTMRLDRFLLSLVLVLPGFIKYKIIRRLYAPELNLPEGIIFKVAEGRDEFRQAFEIQYDQYVQMNYTEANAAEMICSHYHSLPNSHVVVAKIGSEVVATMTIFSDSSFGLPLEGGWDISRKSIKGVRVAELGSLCIKRGRPGLKSRVFLPLSIYCIRFALSYLNIEVLYLATRSKVKDFYSAIFGSRPVQRRSINYGAVKGFKSFAQKIGAEEGAERLRRMYRGFPDHKNLHHLIFHKVIGEFQFPKKRYSRAASSSLNKDELALFFVQKLNVFPDLKSTEVLKLVNEIGVDSYAAAIGMDVRELILKIPERARDGLRHPVSFSSTFREFGGDSFWSGQFFDVASEGARVLVPEGLELSLGSIYVTTLRLEGEESCGLKFKLMWFRDGFAGFSLLESSGSLWPEMIEHFQGNVEESDASVIKGASSREA